MQAIFKSPFLVRALTNTDPGSFRIIQNAINRYLSQVAPRQIVEEARDVERQAIEQLRTTADEISQREDVQKAIGDISRQVQDIRPPVTAIELPEIQPTRLPDMQGSLAQDPAIRAAILTGQRSVV